MSDKIMPMSKAVEGYDLFDKMKVQKGVLPTVHFSRFVGLQALVVFEAQK